MSLVSDNIQIAAQIAKIEAQFKRNAGNPAQQIISLIGQADDPQAVLDTMSRPADSIAFVNAYAAFMANFGIVIPTIDTDVYQPNEDGTVTYVAPPEPEIEP